MSFDAELEMVSFRKVDCQCIIQFQFLLMIFGNMNPITNSLGISIEYKKGGGEADRQATLVSLIWRTATTALGDLHNRRMPHVVSGYISDDAPIMIRQSQFHHGEGCRSYPTF
jgi:hypothetical protein